MAQRRRSIGIWIGGRNLMIETGLCYDDVLLVPQYSDIRSRAEVDISANLDEQIKLGLPIISSPMDTVTGMDMAVAMGKAGGSAVIHRYNSIEEQCELAINAIRRGTQDSTVYVGAAVGVTDDYLERAQALVNVGVSFLCVDVAHGHHISVKEAIEKIKTELEIHIMAGNVATKQGFKDLSSWGADSVRCNIGGGSACTTRIQTGHGVPGLQTIIECARIEGFRVTGKKRTKVIADGGIRNSGDIVKALAAGADLVMLGSLLAGTDEAPGRITEGNIGQFKEYRGMASKKAQFEWRGRASSLEGVSTFIPYKGSVVPILEDLAQGIKSGLSYSGCRNIKELQESALMIQQTPNGFQESGAHILK